MASRGMAHQPQMPLYCRNIKFGGINFRQCGKGRHILYVIINTGQKIRVIKISPMRADGKIGENFLLAKISAYTVSIKRGEIFVKRKFSRIRYPFYK